MVKTIAQLFPGCSFASGVYSIPVSALNSILTSPMSTSVDSGASLVYALLESLWQQQQSGVLQNFMAAVSIDAKNSTKSVYETSQVSTTTIVHLSTLLHCFAHTYHLSFLSTHLFLFTEHIRICFTGFISL